MAEKGERHNNQGSALTLSNRSTVALPDLNISRDDSANWQQLAKIPEPEFEEAMAMPGVKRLQ